MSQQMDRYLKYLWNRNIVYRQDPTTDIPDVETDQYMFYKDGTYECYDLFRSKAKINTFRSLKWHLLVLWYLNPELDTKGFIDISKFIANRDHGYTTFSMSSEKLDRVISDVMKCDLEEPPKNRIRKVIFKVMCGLDKSEKLSIVGQLIGRVNKISPEDIYECMLILNDQNKKITISRISKLLNVTPRTIHRRMCIELKKEKQSLNEQI